MSDQPSLKFIGERLERLQQDLGTMRLRDEQREMAYQAMFQTLTRQIVELADQVTNQIERHAVSLEQQAYELANEQRVRLVNILASFETRLMERLGEIEQRLPTKE